MKGQNVIPFDFGINTIRAITDEHGSPWFVARDIAEILGYSNTAKMTRLLDDDEKKNLEIKEGPFQFGGTEESHNKKEGPFQFGTPSLCMMTIISESGLYTAIIRSDKESARPFRRWVTHEVLPSIRKTGQYTLLVNAFLRADPAEWERQFPPQYYQALCRLFGFDRSLAPRLRVNLPPRRVRPPPDEAPACPIMKRGAYNAARIGHP